MNSATRTELIACIDAGAAARTAGADHGSNPHLVVITTDLQTLQLQRCEAWWDGWEEVDRVLSLPLRFRAQFEIF